MFRTLRNLFRRKPTPATQRVMDDIEKRRALTARDDNRTIAEQVAHLDKSRAVPPPHVGIDLDPATAARVANKATQAKPTPIWPVGCRYVIAKGYDSSRDRLRDIFYPCPIPSDVVFINGPTLSYGLRNCLVMVAEQNASAILDAHLQGAILIDPWGKPVDMHDGEHPAVQRGRDMAESARKREEETSSMPVIMPVVLDAADLPDFHSHREPEPFVGGGGDFGGGGASGSWDSSPSTPDTSPSYDSSPSSDSSSSYDSGSSSSDSGSSGGGDW